MRAANVGAAIAITIWLLLALVGLSLFNGVVAQHVPGYPNSGQTIWLLRWPLLTVAILVGGMLICNVLKRGFALLGAIAVIAVVAILPWLFGIGGGV